jgi:hypothetical protein
MTVKGFRNGIQDQSRVGKKKAVEMSDFKNVEKGANENLRKRYVQTHKFAERRNGLLLVYIQTI